MEKSSGAIRVIRVLEYVYTDAETMINDMDNW